MATTIIAFIIVLGVLIFVHELGHFLTAKRAGLDVEEFGFGFPPRLFSITRGGTRYSLNWIPFGGFVKILGEGGEQQNNPKSFAAKGVGVRAIIVAAGIIMNFLLAYVLLVIVNTAGITSAIDPEMELPANARVEAPVVTITQVDADSPAFLADLRPGDQIASINGENVTDEHSVIEKVNQSEGDALSLTVLRGRNELHVDITPRVAPPDGEGPLGIGLLQTATVRFPWYQSLWEAAKQLVFLTGQIFVVFAEMIKSLVTTGKVGADVAGPIGIAVMTGHVLDLGIVALLQFTALLSINLGIVNALPFPALDGGRLFFLLLEKIRRRKVSKKIENAVHSVGFGLLLVLILVITFRDFVRFNIVDVLKRLF
jgi:regulator of sigma E protease